MKKSPAIFFTALLALHFICANVYAFGFLHKSNAKRHIEIPAKFSHLNSFENEEGGAESTDLLNLDKVEHFHFSHSQLFSSHNISLLDKVTIGLRCNVPLYLCNHVFLI